MPASRRPNDDDNGVERMTYLRPTSHESDHPKTVAPGDGGGPVRVLSPPEHRGGQEGAAGASDLMHYMRVLTHRWRLIAGAVAGVVTAVAIGTMLQDPVYRASGLIELRGQSSEGGEVDAIFQAQRLSNQFLETQYGLLRSPALAHRSMLALGLLGEDGAEGAADTGGGGMAGAVDDTSLASVKAGSVVQRQVDAFENGLMVDPVTGSSLVWLHYESTDPHLAADVVNAVIESYREMRAATAREAVIRLAAEVDRVRGGLTTAERELQENARRSGLMVSGTGNDGPEDLPHARVRVLQQQLAEADAERYNR